MWLGVLGCSAPGVPPTPERPKPQAQRDSLIIAVASDPKDLLSVVSESAADSAVIEATGVQPMDVDFDCRMTYKPALASSWIFSADGRTITLSLRDDQVWEDGRPITAEDYRYTFDLAADPNVGWPERASLRRLDADARPKVVDAHTVAFQFTEAYDRATMLSHITLPLVPRHILDAPTVDRASLRTHPLNTTAPMAAGPFRIASWEHGKKLTLDPNEKFVGPKEYKPKLKHVIFTVIPDYADRIAALARGDVDLVDAVSVADADTLATDHPELAFHRRGWRSLDYVAWNNLDKDDYQVQAAAGAIDETSIRPHPLFGDADVRRALTQAIDIDHLIQTLLVSPNSGEVYGRPAVGTITPALCSTHNDAIVRLGFDPAAARSRLQALGWADSNGDGWLDKETRPLRFSLLTSSGNPRRAAAAGMIKENLTAIGIDVQVETLAPEALVDRLRRHDFDAALTGLSAGLWVDPSPVWGTGAEYNFTGYRNPEVDALLAAGLAEPDPERARPIWRQFQQRIYEDQPATFLYWMDEVVALHTRFRNPTIDIVAPYRRLWEWSVPIDRVKYKEPPAP